MAEAPSTRRDRADADEARLVALVSLTNRAAAVNWLAVLGYFLLGRGIKLSLGGLEVELDDAQAEHVFLAASVVLTIVSVRLASLWLPFVASEPRARLRPATALLTPSTAGRISTLTVRLWLVAPTYTMIVISAFLTGNAWAPVGGALALTFLFALCDDVSRRWGEIVHRIDEKGDPATFALWLQSWLRLLKVIAFILVALVGWAALVKGLRLDVVWTMGAICTVGVLCAMLGTIWNFVYPRLNAFGARKYGFAPGLEDGSPSTKKEHAVGVIDPVDEPRG